MGSNFTFLMCEWPAFEAACEKKALAEPCESLFRARRTIEALVDLMYGADPVLTRPYKSDLSTRLHEASFVRILDDGIRAKFHPTRRHGNAPITDRSPDGVIGLFPDEVDVIEIVARAKRLKQSAIAT
ncbi:hypothetical protein GCM10028798_07020 [Humibacter antri]